MSKFTPTNKKNNHCPVCGDVEGKCRTTDTALVLCMNTTDRHSTPSGWTFRGLSKNGLWGNIVPDDGADGLTDLERRVLRDRVKADRQAKRAIEDEERIGKLPTLAARHEVLSNKPHRLTTSQRDDLVRRGLTEAEIDWCLSQGYLWEERGGYGIAAIDPATGLMVGGQKANDERGQTAIGKDGNEYQIPKYSWLLKGQTHLPETDENPLAVWIHPDCDRTMPVEVEVEIRASEGFLKSLIAAIKAWRSDPQVIYIGAAGGIFPEAALSRVFAGLPESGSVTLCPDAGAVSNPNVMNNYENLAKNLSKLKIFWEHLPELNVLWWDQWTKTSPDVDELPEDKKTTQLSFKEFSSISTGSDRSGQTHWIKNRAFSPNHTVDSQYFDFRSAHSGEILAVRSGLGTGKTEWMINKILPQFGGALIFAPTINLCKNVNERINRAGISADTIGSLTTDDRSSTQALRAAYDVITLCPDSILSIDIEEVQGKILILDEAMENARVFWYRKTHISKIRKAAIDRLSELMTAAAAVLLLDGNLTDRGVAWYQALCPNKFTTKILNTRAKKMAIRLHVADGDSNFTKAIAKDGDRFLMGTDCKIDATALSSYPLTSVTCQTGELDQNGKLTDGWAQLAMRDGKAFIEQCKPHNMAYSPVAGSGWDLSGVDGYFDRFYGLYKGVVNVDSINQSIARYRDFSVVRDLFVAGTGLSEYWIVDPVNTSAGAVNESLYRYMSELPGLLASGDTELRAAAQRLMDSAQNDPTAIAVTDEIAALNYERINLRGCLIHSLLGAGHTIEVVRTALKEAAKRNEVRTKSEINLEAAAAVRAANTISASEAQKIETARIVAPGRLAELSRFNLESRLPGIAQSESWNSIEVIKKGKEGKPDILEADAFVHALPKLASKSENFWLLMHPEVAKKRGQSTWQVFLKTGWVDLSKLNIRYARIKKVRDIFSEFLPNLFTLKSEHEKLEMPSERDLQPEAKTSFLLRRDQLCDLARKLTSGKGGLGSFNGRSYVQYFKDLLNPYGVSVVQLGKKDSRIGLTYLDPNSNLEQVYGEKDLVLILECLDQGSDLGQVYAAVDRRFSPGLDEPVHVWEIPETMPNRDPDDLSVEWANFSANAPETVAYIDRGPIPESVEEFDGGTYEYVSESDAVATAVLGGSRSDWEDFITQMVALSTSDPIAYQSHKATPGLAPDWVWSQLECEDF